MEALKRRATVAVLWIISAVAMSAHMILMVLDPAALKKGGQWAAAAGAADWILTAVFWLMPLWMAVVAMTAVMRVNRRVNVVAGILMTLLNTYHLLICAVPVLPGGPFAEATAHHSLLVGTSLMATALVAWMAWRWPRQDT